MKAAAARWIRRAGILLAAFTLLAVACALVDSHVENELRRVSREAATAYIKASRFPLRSKPGHEDLVDLVGQRLAREEIEEVAIAAHVSGDVGKLSGTDIHAAAINARVALPEDNHIDWVTAKQEVDTAADKARDAWRHDHRAVIVTGDVLDWSVGSFAILAEKTPEVLQPAALYLSLPFKIALGLGFGVALGAWIIKRLNLRP